MPVSKLTIFAMSWALGALLLISSIASSQESLETQEPLEARQNDNNHFVARVSIGLALTGTKIQRDFRLIDENNFRYDVMGLLNPAVRLELGLSDEQNNALNEVHRATKASMIAQITPALVTEETDELKSVFLEAQEQMRAVFSEEQRVRFDALKHFEGIRTAGLGNYLNSSHFGGEPTLSTEEIETLTVIEKNISTQVDRQTQELLKKANQELLEQLSEEQLETVKRNLKSGVLDTFLTTDLFTQRYPARKPRLRRKADLLRLVKLKSTRSKLDISPRQHDEIIALERHQSDEIKNILDDEQLQELQSSIVETELARMGTVNALCGGYLVQFLDLDDETAEKMFVNGKRIFRNMESDRQSLRQETFTNTLRRLPPALQQRITKSVGALSNSQSRLPSTAAPAHD